MTENKSPWYSTAVWNGVEIDLPFNHDLETYGKALEWKDYNKLTDPTASLQSLKFKEIGDHGNPLFTARFKVPYNAISDIACGFFVLEPDETVVIEAVGDGVIIEAVLSSVCSIGKTVGTGSSKDPETYWFERAKAQGRTDFRLIEHLCEGTEFEYLVAVQEGDLSPIETDSGISYTGEDITEWFEEEINSQGDEIDNDIVEIVENVTAPDGSEWRVMGIQLAD